MKADAINIKTMCWICLVFHQRHHRDFEDANYNAANVLGGGRFK